jgi:hypothetical protein
MRSLVIDCVAVAAAVNLTSAACDALAGHFDG